MKLLIVFAVPILCVAASYDLSQWSAFKLKYGKSYTSLEEKFRYKTFQDNLRTIKEHNVKYENGEVGYFMGVNKFADQTREEFGNKLINQKLNKPETKRTDRNFVMKDEFPKKLDWREKGAVLGVKDQKNCSISWVFSATGALEGQNAIVNNVSISLSEQQFLDCAETYGTYGCVEGSVDACFHYVQDLGIVSEEYYPYKANDLLNCKIDRSKSVIRSLYGYESVQRLNETALLYAVAEIGPITAGLNFDLLHLYAGGIFDDKSCLNFDDDLNQTVLIVGYDTTSETPYWIIKHSWGADWGEKGYLRLQQGSNICGITMNTLYPILE